MHQIVKFLGGKKFPEGDIQSVAYDFDSGDGDVVSLAAKQAVNRGRSYSRQVGKLVVGYSPLAAKLFNTFGDCVFYF